MSGEMRYGDVIPTLTQKLDDPEAEDAQALLNKISRHANTLKGTRPYWYLKRWISSESFSLSRSSYQEVRSAFGPRSACGLRR